MMGRALPLAASVLFSLSGCTSPPQESAGGPTTATAISGPVVARVDGDPIALSEVTALTQATGLSPREALGRLVDERVLVHYGQRAGYTQTAAVQREARRAAVRALLREQVERGRDPADISQAAVAERFEQVRERYDIPELRDVSQVLFRYDPKQAGERERVQREAEALLREVQRVQDPKQARRVLQAAASAHQGDHRVRFETLRVKREQHGFEAAFADPVNRARQVGPLAEPLETRHGIHVVLIEAIHPAQPAVLHDLEQGIRERLSFEAKQAALEAMLEELRAQVPVQLDERVVNEALADEDIWGGVT